MSFHFWIERQTSNCLLPHWNISTCHACQERNSLFSCIRISHCWQMHSLRMHKPRLAKFDSQVALRYDGKTDLCCLPDCPESIHQGCCVSCTITSLRLTFKNVFCIRLFWPWLVQCVVTSLQFPISFFKVVGESSDYFVWISLWLERDAWRCFSLWPFDKKVWCVYKMTTCGVCHVLWFIFVVLITCSLLFLW